MAFFVATCSYYATGEGIQQYIFAAPMPARENFETAVKNRLGEYLAMGTDIHDNYESMIKDPLLRYLSDPIKDSWKEFFETGTTEAGAYVFYVEFFANYS